MFENKRRQRQLYNFDGWVMDPRVNSLVHMFQAKQQQQQPGSFNDKNELINTWAKNNGE